MGWRRRGRAGPTPGLHQPIGRVRNGDRRTWARENLPFGFATPDFIDATHWVAADGAEITATADGGKTWKVAQDAGLPAGSFTQLVFLDPQIGFGLFSAADGSGSYLYRTDNGGYEWELVCGGVSPAPF